MIKIVKSGHTENFYIKCGFCWCYFTSTKSDMSKEEEYGRFTYYVDCPECSKQLSVDERDLSYHYQKSLKYDLGLIKDEDDY